MKKPEGAGTGEGRAKCASTRLDRPKNKTKKAMNQGCSEDSFDASNGYSPMEAIDRAGKLSKLAGTKRPRLKKADKWKRLMEELGEGNSEISATSRILVTGAIVTRDPAFARETLRYAATYLMSGNPVPRLVAIYLAQAFEDIANGASAEQALCLKLNARKRVDLTEQIQLYFRVIESTKKGETLQEALRLVAPTLRITPTAAAKRFAAAQETIGAWWAYMERGVRQGYPPAMSTLHEALLGETSRASPADDLLKTAVSLFARVDRKKAGPT